MAVLTEVSPAASPLAPYVSTLLRENVAHGAVPETFSGAVLLLDIVDSSGLANRYAAEGPEGAERLSEVLAAHFKPAFDLLTERGGDIVAMEGDSITVLWRDAPNLPPSAGRAATAALALRGLLQDKVIRQRILVAAGALHALPIMLSSERGLFLLAGPPLRELGALAAHCAPGEVVFAQGIEPGAEMVEPTLDLQVPTSALAPYLPPGTIERAALGRSGWSTEFRTVTAMLLRLDGLLPEMDEGAPLGRALRLIEGAIEGLSLGIAEVIEGDKGTVVGIFAGLPPFVLDQNAAGVLEAARRISALFEAESMPFGIGIATGRAFTGEVGTDTRKMRIVLGPVMSLAARLMQAAQSEALVDPETVATASKHFAFDEPIALLTKGRTDPVAVRRLLGRMGAVAVGRTEIGGLFGRTNEQAQLEAFLDHAPGGLALIEGEPGVGKSRLLAQALRLAEDRGRLILTAAAQAIEQDTAYSVLRQVLTVLLGLTEEATPADTAARLRASLADEALLARAEPLSDMMPLDLDALGPQQRLSGAARPAAVTEIMLRLIVAQEQPLFLLLDDAHWLDGSSAQVLSALLRRVPRLVVIAATRPLEADARPEIRSLFGMSLLKLSLARLDRAATVDLVRGLLGVSAVHARLADHIFNRSEGLPLHAEQLALAMRERGLLYFAPDRRQVEADLSGETGVETLRDVILRRIDRLPAEQQLVLKVASVLGRTPDPALLTATHPEGPPPQAVMRALEEAGLLQGEGNMLGFRHIRIQEAVYDLLPFAQRRSLHRAAAEATEAIHRHDIDQHCAALATHWERAGEPARGASWRLRAAERALASAAHLDTLTHLRAIDALGGYETLLPNPGDRAAYARLFGLAAEEASEFDTAHEWLMRYGTLTGVQVSTGRGAMIRRILVETGKQVLLRAGVLRAFRDQDRMAQAAASSTLHWRLGEQGYFKGDSLKMLHGHLVALNSAERGVVPRDVVLASSALSVVLSIAGTQKLADYYQRRAIAIGESTDSWTKGIAYLFAAVQGTTVADWPRTVTQSEVAAEIFASIGEHYRFVTSHVMLAYARLAIGEIYAARDLLRPFGEFAEELDNPPARGWTLMARALIDLMTGAPPTSALERLAVVQEEWLSAGERVMWRCLLGAAAFAAGDRPRAETECDTAIGLMRHILGVGHAYHSVNAMASACLAMARDGRPQSKTRAAEALKQVRRFSQAIAAGRPYTIWLEGRAAQMSGSARRAERLWRRGLLLAKHHGMPFEAALCLRALGDPIEAEARLSSKGMVPWIEFGERNTQQ